MAPLRRALLLAAAAAAIAPAASLTVRVVGGPENDVVQLLFNVAAPWPMRLYDNVSAALSACVAGDALLAFADAGWPNASLPVSAADFAAIAARGVRAFLEMPSSLPGDAAAYEPGPIDPFARGVVQGAGLAAHGLHAMDLLQVQGFIGQAYPQVPYVSEALIVYAHVAGTDTAVFGLPEVSLMLPLLFSVNASAAVPVLVSAAKLSNIITGRFAPASRFRAVWNYILASATAAPGFSAFPAWAPRVAPVVPQAELQRMQADIRGGQAGSAAAAAAAGASSVAGTPPPVAVSPVELPAFLRATDWLASSEAGMLRYGDLNVCPAPYAPADADVVCMLEGYGSAIAWDGTQALASNVRQECVTETAMALALRAWLDASTSGAQTDGAPLVPVAYSNGAAGVATRDGQTMALVPMPPLPPQPTRAWPHGNRSSGSDAAAAAVPFARYAAGLLNYNWLYSVAIQGPLRGNISSPSYAVLAWGVSGPTWLACQYADGNGYVIQAATLAHIVLKQAPLRVDTAAWDRMLMRNLLANVRLASAYGFRPGRINYVDLEANGWQHYANSGAVYNNTLWPQPHYQSYMHMSFLWAYVRTGYAPFYDKVVAAVADTMRLYPDLWEYNEYLTEEQARFLHLLAWLVRADKVASGGKADPQHEAWLQRLTGDVLARQVPLGGFQERFGNTSNCDYCPPQTNAAYGSNEAPITQGNNDTCTDQLYTNNFLLMALHEAYGATGDARVGTASDLLATYLASIQSVAPSLPQVSGSWPRAFDYARYEYWGSSADMGWGAFSVESGWTTTWISAALALRSKGLFLWDLFVSDDNGINRALFAEVCPEFFPPAQCTAAEAA